MYIQCIIYILIIALDYINQYNLEMPNWINAIL